MASTRPSADGDSPSSAEIDGISIPDSALCRAVTEFVRDTETELLFNHSSRVYFFGALAGKKRGLTFNPRTALCGDDVPRRRPDAVAQQRESALRGRWRERRPRLS
jgi:hypothetical protein